MDQIKNYIADPAWWFSTVLVAIIASVIAGFMKDRISQLFGHVSKRFRIWSQKRTQQQEELIAVLSENPNYLLMGLGRTLMMAIMFTGTIIIYLIFPVYAKSQPLSSLPGVDGLINSIASVVIYPFFGGISMAYGYRATSALSVMTKAIRQYRQKNGFPKLP
ncbi:MAG: hypothetical protein KGL39_59245 [Patescibacteria group bacterium]|nr:hypothetical protein [Patescibacteria group bacterium]